VAVAVDVTGLTATPFDQTAVQNNLTVATNTPTVSTPTLSQTNEIIFGAIAGDQTLIGYGFVESSTMTTTTPNGWSAGTWDSGTTYNAGDRVIFENIPWQSLKNSNTGNNPQSDLNLNVALVNWQPISVTPTIFGPGSTFHGDPKLTPGQLKGGCVIVSQFNNAAAFALPTGNGNTVENVYIYGNDNSHLHCGQPNTGVAFAGLSGTGGPNRTKLVNVGVQNFYMALGFGLASIQNIGNAGGANLGAENHVHNAFVANACYGFAVRNQQGFMNSVYDSDFDATNMILTNSEVGVEVLGGNYSTENGIAPGAKFAMSGVSAAYIGGGPNGIEITATLTVAGDPYMTDPLSDCNDVRGVGVVNLFPNTFCEGAVYNSFMLHTADYGVIPLIMTSWNHTTRAATFWVLNSWFTAFGTACCGSALTTEINAQANVWAAEMVRTFSGAGIVAERLHIETTQPWQLTDSTIGFGAPDATVLRSIKINAPIDNCGSYSPGNAQSEAWCFSQQEFPWINVGSDIVIQDICCNAGITEFNMVDFPQAITNGGGHMNVRGWQMGQFNFRYPANTIFTNIGNLTGGDGGYGSPAFGSGNYDVSPFTGAALPGQSNTNSVDQAWLDRTQGIGASPFVGTRPAPWSTPCLSPLQEAKVLNVNNSLPIPYLDGNGAWQINYPLLFSGQQYRICSFGGGLDSTAWSNAVGYFQGSVVTNAGTTYVSMVGSGDFLSNLNHTPGTAMTFTGSIANTECASPPANTGAFTGCLTVTATGVAGQILINSPVTGAGVAAGTTIIAQATGSSGSTGTYVIVPRQTVASETLTANYWASLGATPHFGIVSNHGGGYSYGIDFTTATNNGLSWSEANASPFFNLTGGRFDQLFPGTVVGLAGTQAGCTTQENFVIRGIHQTLLFFDTFRIDQDIGGGIVPGFSGATCSNTVMHQAPYSIVNLN
jgi:hypothetical protein